MALGLAACFTMSAQNLMAPSIMFPEAGKSVILDGLSDNGKYAVSGISKDVEKEGGAILYDISGTSAKKTVLSENGMGTTAMDVTDDGSIVVGATSGSPAFWTNGKGWTKLPLPSGYQFGYATAVTPDGKLAVGRIQKDVDGMQAEGCLWDLTTNKIVEVPCNATVIDLSNTIQDQNWYTQISADGRYIFGTVSFSYPADTRLYVIDRQEDRVIYIDADEIGRDRIPGLVTWETDVDAKALSSNGKWVAGTVDDANTGDDLAFYFDVENEQLYVTNGKNEENSWAWSITNNGTPLCTRPALDLYGECYVYYDNYYFPLADILEGCYGLNLARLGITNTGKPVLVSDDGRTIVLITSQYDSYILKLKEDIEKGCEKVDLLQKWTSTPSNGTIMSSINQVKINFAQYIQTSETNYTKVQLLDKDGNLVANPLSNGGLDAKSNSLTINFRTRKLNEGETYTLFVPAGVVWVDGRPSSTNGDIRINFVGRGDGSVKVTNVTPESGSQLASLDVSENPIILTYNASVKVNEALDSYIGYLYIDEEENPISPIIVAPYTDKQLIAYPQFLQYLYKGSKYKVVIPEGIAVDLSGQGPSEELVLEYEGTYIPTLGDDIYIFRSGCDDFTNFLFYDGDQGEPTAEYAEMGFTYNTTPWWVVREDDNATDMAFGSHSCYVDGRQADDWVSTRQLTIPENEDVYLAFDAQSYRMSKTDILKVYIYEFEGNINALNKTNTDNIRKDGDLVYDERLSPGATEGNLTGEWTHVVIPLDKYKGKKIYIAWVNENQNQSMVMIDNIEVVRDLKSLLTISNQSNVVNQDAITIKGILNVLSETDTYNGVSMKLKDAAGNEISSISDPNKTLSAGELYNFEFPQQLPLVLGEENPYVIEYTLGDMTTEYEGIIRDLTFEPRKRVLLEKFTGRDCQFCPGGIAMLTRLEDMYRDQLIPVEIHGYNSSDPKGMNVLQYAQYFNFTGAPQAIINRRGRVAGPIYYSDEQKKYVASINNLSQAEAATVTIPLWQDEVADELKEPALMDVSVSETSSSENAKTYTATVRSAINLEDQNIRVFGVLLEDGLRDYQSNAYYLTDDDLLGDWGLNGKYNQNTVTTWTFNNVARSTWGQSYNGTGGLLPSVINSSEEYKIEMNVPLPRGFVENPDNLKFVVVLIDQNTGKVINACISNDMSGVEGIESELGAAPVIYGVPGGVQIESATRAQVQVYSTAGMLLANGEGEGSFTLDLNGYRGVAIVRAINADGTTSIKIVVR